MQELTLILRIEVNTTFFFRCCGLILLETYSALEHDQLLERLPKFLTIVEEVTGNPAYSMFNLSLREDWTNSTKFCKAFQGKYLI